MTRRSGLMALMAIVVETFRVDAATRQSLVSSGSTVTTSTLVPMEEFTIQLGSPSTVKRYVVTNGEDRVTFTVDELMKALKS